MSQDSKPVVCVTGASRGIGLATVKSLLAEQDANVVAMSRSTNDALSQLQAEYPDRLLQIHGDITDPKTSQDAVTGALEKFGQITGIVLNAGVLGPSGPIASLPFSGSNSWQSLMDVNFFALLHTTQAALPALRKSKGKIIFVSSGLGVRSIYGMAAHCASKAAMNSLCRTLGVEEPDVTSLAVMPGSVNTDMQTDVRNARNFSDKDRQYLVGLYKEGKLIDPSITGYLLGKLSISADPSLSGQLIDGMSEEFESYRRQ